MDREDYSMQLRYRNTFCNPEGEIVLNDIAGILKAFSVDGEPSKLQALHGAWFLILARLGVSDSTRMSLISKIKETPLMVSNDKGEQ